MMVTIDVLVIKHESHGIVMTIYAMEHSCRHRFFYHRACFECVFVVRYSEESVIVHSLLGSVGTPCDYTDAAYGNFS